MRAIVKGREPSTLTRHRLTPSSESYSPNYNNYNDKNALRKTLVEEQKGLCCYCMGKINSKPIEMKIEHWQCQERYPLTELDYGNLLAACPGGEGLSPRYQHCDTKKRNADLKWNPADPMHFIESRVRYEPDGSIRSDDPVFDGQLCQVLNLNLAKLKNMRKGKFDGVMGWWNIAREKRRGPVPRSTIVRKRKQQTPKRGEVKPYCQVAIWLLDQKLKMAR